MKNQKIKKYLQGELLFVWVLFFVVITPFILMAIGLKINGAVHLDLRQHPVFFSWLRHSVLWCFFYLVFAVAGFFQLLLAKEPDKKILCNNNAFFCAVLTSLTANLVLITGYLVFAVFLEDYTALTPILKYLLN